MIDKDNSGELDGPEFKLALKYLNLRLNDRQIEVVMKHLDQDGDGTISIEEFLNLVWEGKLKQLRIEQEQERREAIGVVRGKRNRPAPFFPWPFPRPAEPNNMSRCFQLGYTIVRNPATADKGD